MTDKVQKIREEVARMHNLLPVMDGDNISVNYADRICTTLEMYIDSLQEEPVSEELEKAAEQDVCEVVNCCSATGIPNDHIPSWVQDAMINEFIHGAKWQKEKDFQHVKKECERTGSCCDNDIAIEAAKRHPYYYASEMEACANIGFKEGANWQKEKMMANAVDVTVHIDAGGYQYTQEIELYDYDKDVPLAKEGDKYKVILIKED